MKSAEKNLCKYFCRKCNNYIFYNEACELIFKKIYPQYNKIYYNKNELNKKSNNNIGNNDAFQTENLKLYDNLYRQIYSNGLCGVNKQRNDFLKKDNVYNMLGFLNNGGIKCTKCNKDNIWYMK
ncbi:conserved Plasmodium protein, unknown function [Plasmodium berghei]|uniref:Uncharacterized protein n=2 Tax=Plasmodium berghei TaxID=5821 RepID=A0A509AQF9_PLABA|nr:conserved Plasmodium protein, unknown function [Plasmodium berghei ANKA]CXI46394.1 conserved Plasmodium protein, unknown function [Plasmodium berghei]SCM22780.1 conserved Plasmodium protein, unknown function [Plasmodium berghei]SCN25684.1 conserved Plasmodium protein, unknown function [Plasmodium berghei]SCO60607.1 conserved Plasmodium protein, unknown function [Plasmodium berghei]SCO62340.1 conserved Plasmodium protein, unknown function [Plasmodium berghei]|eukprot:XP_034421757.1 conserved Plasmodium protein, unknown function [Plasmodium berghei ANKA]